MRFIIDPRDGDIEDDASSTKRYSLLSLAGSLLVEVSFAKLLMAWTILIVLPGALLGLAPLLASAWLSVVVDKAAALAGIGSLIILLLVGAAGLLGLRHLFALAELSFWSLTALLVQPVYALIREAIRHVAEHFLRHRLSDEQRVRVRAAGAAIAGIVVFIVATAIAAFAWRTTRWTASMSDLATPLSLIAPALSNMAVLVMGYLGIGSLFWGVADATMDQPRGLKSFDTAPSDAAQWRIAHISDIHLVGERYGYRIECGRYGPSGNERFDEVLGRLDTIHAKQPLDYIIITGDLTDAGRSSEWVEFLTSVERYPALLERTLVLPGNHDINVVDRANPARLELPGSAGKRLRQMRALSAVCAVQGARVRIVDPDSYRVGAHLADALKPHEEDLRKFADGGGLRRSWRLGHLWSDVFPLVVLPAVEDGLGFILLNSNAEANFSFTNALGLVPFTDAKAAIAVIRSHPRARWIIGLHHHLVEYPMPAEAFSERIGTALINGSWFLRELKPFAHRIAIMHGHRHIDWIGQCGDLKVISGPSPVMPTKGDAPPAFYVHTFAAADDKLSLLSSEQIQIAGAPN
jgi:predicted MPP superfamily phosphohydrolase